MTYIAMTIVGGRAPFNIMRKDRVSRSRRLLHVNGLRILQGKHQLWLEDEMEDASHSSNLDTLGLPVAPWGAMGKLKANGSMHSKREGHKSRDHFPFVPDLFHDRIKMEALPGAASSASWLRLPNAVPGNGSGDFHTVMIFIHNGASDKHTGCSQVHYTQSTLGRSPQNRSTRGKDDVGLPRKMGLAICGSYREMT